MSFFIPTTYPISLTISHHGNPHPAVSVEGVRGNASGDSKKRKPIEGLQQKSPNHNGEVWV